MPKPTIIGTGLSGLVGDRFVSLFHDKYDFENVDLTTGVDITKPEAVKKVLKESRGEVVLHLAAFTNVTAAFDQAGDKNGLCYKVNVEGTRNVAQYSKEFGKFLIHISTDFIFDGKKEEPFSETDSPNPIEWYGETKLMAEKEVEKIDGDYTILRLAYPYRAHHSERPDLIRTIIAKLKEGSMYPPFTDHIITPTFIDDICNVFDLVIDSKPNKELFHCVGSSWHSDYEITKMINDVFEINGSFEKGSLEKYLKTSNRPYQKTTKISNQKLIDTLGYTPKTLNEGLKILKRQISSL